MPDPTPDPGAPPTERASRVWLDLAARCAARAEGMVEPNPLVGCVIVPGGETIEVASRSEASAMAAAGRVGAGHHRVFGGPHAEVEALRACAEHGLSTKGATAFVTLEPCDRWGKTGPCAEALAKAGVKRVVCAREDDTQEGATTLGREGVDVLFTGASVAATALSDPFFHRVSTGLPWVIAKWAQTLDGKSATSSGESRWLTGPVARRSVHTLRGRVDAIMTGIGTVLADDPALTARGVPLRRTALRVVIDPNLETPPDSKLAMSARGAPVLCVCAQGAAESREKVLEERGVRVLRLPASAGVLDLRSVLGALARDEGVSTLMTECGPRLLGRLLDADAVDELRAYIAPMVLGDGAALPTFVGGPIGLLEEVHRWRLLGVRRRGEDLEARYRRM